MDQETRKLEERIKTERERFGQNVVEFESRIKDAASPRRYYEKNSKWVLGGAAATGFLFALLMGKSR
jgi:ElaB/YqjD/DUF883 family membrane-anchored ribosome-binding protein